MPQVTVYKHTAFLDEGKFSGGFGIFVVQGALFWAIDGSGWRTDNRQNILPATLPHGACHVDLLHIAHYIFRFIRPDWLLKVNNAACEPGFYPDLSVTWPTLSLVYCDYKFVLQFDEGDVKEGLVWGDTTLPVPQIRAIAPNLKLSEWANH